MRALAGGAGLSKGVDWRMGRGEGGEGDSPKHTRREGCVTRDEGTSSPLQESVQSVNHVTVTVTLESLLLTSL